MTPERLAFALGALLLSPATTHPQEARIEQARQFEPAGTAANRAGRQPLPAGPRSVENLDDAGDFGVQQLLREEDQPRYFQAFAEVSAFVTNNVALTPRDTLADAFLVATFGMGYQRPLARGLTWDANVQVSTFRYDDFPQLSFQSIDAGLGLTYHAERLGGVDFFARYNFNELIGDESGEEFFHNHTLALGLQKSVVLGPAHSVFAGISGLLGFADPKSAERSEITAYAGYHLSATRKLDFDLLYRGALYLYTEDHRQDWNQTLSLGLRYRFTEWLSASVSSYFGWNRSNRPAFAYDVANGGGAVTLSIQF